jgi:CDP-diacylglycerol--glycerol-3-phosphate 3-phosphatidyltransferase
VLRHRVVPASRGGKIKTIIQAVAISFFLVPLWVVVGDWIYWVNYGLMTVAVLATVVTGIDYLYRARGSRTA